MATSPVRLNHAVLYVSDLGRSVEFYGTVLGFEVAVGDSGGRAAFLRLPRSGNHHDLGLFGVGVGGGGGTAGARRPGPGLYHLAWQVDTVDELVGVRDALTAASALVGASDHGATKSLYGVDPDGIEFEVMWMLPRSSWGDLATTAGVDRLDLDAEVARWGGVATAWPDAADIAGTDLAGSPPADTTDGAVPTAAAPSPM